MSAFRIARYLAFPTLLCVGVTIGVSSTGSWSAAGEVPEANQQLRLEGDLILDLSKIGARPVVVPLEDGVYCLLQRPTLDGELLVTFLDDVTKLPADAVHYDPNGERSPGERSPGEPSGRRPLEQPARLPPSLRSPAKSDSPVGRRPNPVAASVPDEDASTSVEKRRPALLPFLPHAKSVRAIDPSHSPPRLVAPRWPIAPLRATALPDPTESGVVLPPDPDLWPTPSDALDFLRLPDGAVVDPNRFDDSVRPWRGVSDARRRSSSADRTDGGPLLRSDRVAAAEFLGPPIDSKAPINWRVGFSPGGDRPIGGPILVAPTRPSETWDSIAKRTISFHFRDASLGEVAGFFHHATGMTVRVELPNSRLSGDRVGIHVLCRDKSVRQSLRVVLGSCGLAYLVRDHELIIAESEFVAQAIDRHDPASVECWTGQ